MAELRDPFDTPQPEQLGALPQAPAAAPSGLSDPFDVATFTPEPVAAPAAPVAAPAAPAGASALPAQPLEMTGGGMGATVQGLLPERFRQNPGGFSLDPEDQRAMSAGVFGFGPEVEATLAALYAKSFGGPGIEGRTFTDLRNEALRQRSGGEETFVTESPGKALAADLIGGAVSGAGLARGALAAPKLGPALAKRPIANVAATGAAGGALAGGGYAEPGESLQGATEGGALGLGLGLIMSGASGAARTAWRNARPGVKRRLQGLAQASGLTPGQIESRLRALGRDATIADVADVFRGAGDLAASRLGPSMRFVRELIERDTRQFSRIMEPIRKHFGSRDLAIDTLEGLKKAKETRASPHYNNAFARGLDYNGPGMKEVRRLMRRPAAQRAWKYLKKHGADDPDIPDEMLRQVVSGRVRPSMLALHHVGRYLWGLAQQQKGPNGNPVIRRGLENLRRQLLDAVEEAELLQHGTQEYRTARSVWHGASNADEMVEAGSMFLRRPLGEVRETFANADPGEREFLLVGVGNALEEKLAKIVDTADASRVLRTPDFRERLRAVMPDEAAVDELLTTIQNEAIKKATTTAVGRGSQTYGRLAAQQQLGGRGVTLSPEDLTAQGQARRALGAMGSIGGPREGTIQGIGEFVLSQDPATQARALAIMRSGLSLPPAMQLQALGQALRQAGVQGTEPRRQ